eukprot:SAG22_NODE_246_length_13948_cov_12.055744_3_plen_98_part_00
MTRRHADKLGAELDMARAQKAEVLAEREALMAALQTKEEQARGHRAKIDELEDALDAAKADGAGSKGALVAELTAQLEHATAQVGVAAAVCGPFPCY